jgi:hypothetical protein
VVDEVVAMEETPDVHMVVGIPVAHRAACTVMEIQMADLLKFSTMVVSTVVFWVQ